MTALYIVLGILSGLVLLLLSSVSLKICIDDDIQLVLRYLFIRKKMPYKPEKIKTAEEKAEEESEREAKKAEPYIKKSIKEKGIAATVSELSDVLRTVIGKLGKLAGHIRVRIFKLDITAATDDPAVTAIEYGGICAAVFPVISMLRNLLKFNDRGTEISIKSDFCGGKPDFRLDAKIKLRLWFILTAAVSILIKLVKIKLSGEISKKSDNTLKAKQH